jgi:hypothetical protein
VFTKYLKRSRVNSTFEADHPIPGINQLLLHLTHMYAPCSPKDSWERDNLATNLSMCYYYATSWADSPHQKPLNPPQISEQSADPSYKQPLNVVSCRKTCWNCKSGSDTWWQHHMKAQVKQGKQEIDQPKWNYEFLKKLRLLSNIPDKQLVQEWYRRCCSQWLLVIKELQV